MELFEYRLEGKALGRVQLQLGELAAVPQLDGGVDQIPHVVVGPLPQARRSMSSRV